MPADARGHVRKLQLIDAELAEIRRLLALREAARAAAAADSSSSRPALKLIQGGRHAR